MSEDKVEPSVVESDSAVGGITDRELASSNGDGKNESKSPAAEDGDDNVNGVNKGSDMNGAGPSIPMGLHFNN
jgi:hypothetical protein